MNIHLFDRGSGLARDAGDGVAQLHRVDAIASKPAPTGCGVADAGHISSIAFKVPLKRLCFGVSAKHCHSVVIHQP
ncbi:hypothetical protein F7Q95_14990 [Pseudomonas psychrophila]|nr:hypothetical protein F7Q95_14990 [Pseudomonas psychrophila]